MDKEKCSTKYCRNEVVLIYLGKPYCQACYEEICDEEDQEYINERNFFTPREVVNLE